MTYLYSMFWGEPTLMMDLQQPICSLQSLAAVTLKEDSPSLDERIQFIKELTLNLAQQTADAQQTAEIDSETVQHLSELIKQESTCLEEIKKIEAIWSNQSINTSNLLDIQVIFSDKVQKHLQDYERLIERLSAIPIKKEISIPETEEAFRELSLYCESFCPNLTLNEAEERISKGAALFEQILQGGTILPQETEAIEDDCANLIWHLMDLALKKGEGFFEGTFVIEDPDLKIYNYLLSARTLHERSSSHYIGRSAPTHHGIDVFSAPLPAQKRTLLFETATSSNPNSYEGKVLYLKPENFSANAYNIKEFLMHTYEYCQSRINKYFYPGSDDLPYMRKERVPVAVAECFSLIVNELEEGRETLFTLPTHFPPAGSLEEIRQLAQIYGIGFMVQFFEALKEKNIAVDTEAFDTLVAGYDYLHFRTGREVYFDFS